MLRAVILFACILTRSLLSANAHFDSEVTRPQEPNPLATFQSCKESIEKLVQKLECKVPPVLYGLGLSFERTMEFGVQFYTARHGVSYEKLNTLVSYTQNDEGKKVLSYFFTGLKCAGLPGDPLNRKNWISYLPSCPQEPPSSPPWYKDNKWSTGTYHPGARVCYRLAAKRPEPCDPRLKTWQCMGGEWLEGLPEAIKTLMVDATPSQQCCFDSENKLITEGAAAGTPDMIFKSQAIEDIVERNFLNKKLKLKTLKMADLEKAFETKGEDKSETKASINHHILDARIITACFPDWPGENEQHLKTYHALGWTPFR